MTFERENSVNTSTFHVSISIQIFVRKLGVSEFGTGIAFDQAHRQKNARNHRTGRADQVTLKLEGYLGGSWVAELENSWRAVNSTLAGRSLRWI
jgi:hypothetical protein